MMAPQKRPKSVLQLVEPPEKSKSDKGQGHRDRQETNQQQQNEHHAPPPQSAASSELVGIPENQSETDELSRKMQEATLQESSSARLVNYLFMTCTSTFYKIITK